MLKSRVVIESLAVSSIVSAFIVSLLVGVNHGGYLFLGLIYIPTLQPVVSIVFYSFLGLAVYYNFLESRQLNFHTGLFRVLYVLGFCMFSVSVSSNIHYLLFGGGEVIDYRVVLFNLLLIIVGLIGESVSTRNVNFLLRLFSDRDLRDLTLLASSLFLLSTIRLVSEEFPLEAAVLFLVSSWTIILYMVKKYIVDVEKSLSNVKNLVTIISVNMFYFYTLLLFF